MIVYLQVPMGPGGTLYDMLTPAMAEEDVVWVGRTLRIKVLRESGLGEARPKILGGPFGLNCTQKLGEVDLFAIMLSDPVARTVTMWERVSRDPNHPFHAVTHTFTLREMIEEQHPLRGQFCNGTTLALTPAGETVSAASALAALKERPFLVGHPDHPRAFTEALCKALDLPSGTIEPRGFRLRQPARLAPDLRELLTTANGHDIHLMHVIEKELMAGAKVLRTKGKAKA
ncbi:hypothetical protein [Acuticoccus kandeliae]|uniref:hypothetical protein n=1 Tax=Acuticoccus kandeliae TaxID=2073160 RepID=UPI001300BCCA|nr:hypothetical protein [Acuticoccus kandeliae]